MAKIMFGVGGALFLYGVAGSLIQWEFSLAQITAVGAGIMAVYGYWDS